MPTVNEARFKNTVLAILTVRPGLGSVQLRKALIIADALHNTLFGKSITGTRYIKFKYGPIPDRDASGILDSMYYDENLIDINEEVEGSTTKNSYYALQEPNDKIFTEEEYKIIKFAAGVTEKYSATKLSDMTHDEVYNNTPLREEIPLDRVCTMTITGHFNTPDFTEEEKRHLIEVLSSNEAGKFTFI